MCQSSLGDLYTKLGRCDEAEPLLAQAAAGARIVRPEGPWRGASFLLGHGVCLSALERYDEAEAALLEAHEIMESALGAQHERTTKVVKALADLYKSWDAADPGKGYDAKAAEWGAKLPDTDPDSRSP